MSARDLHDATGPLLHLLQLQRRARDAASTEALGFVIANETLQLAAYRQAALWSEDGLGRVVAVSGLPQVDATAPYVQWLTTACRHLMRSAQPAGALDEASLPAALRDDGAQWLPANVLWLPLAREGGPPQAALLLARDEPWSAHEVGLLKELGHAYGHALAAFAPQRSLASRGLHALRGSRARRLLALAALLVCLVPVRVTVLAQAEVMPSEAFTVRAPLDGVVDHFDVRPNQPVKKGDALFSLDTTLLRTKLALARQAVDTAQEEYRQSAQVAVTSDKDRAETAMRRARLQERALELDYTDEQLARVQLKADRDGIAVFADTNEWIGRAVTLGERVLQVADPAKVELQAWLPTADAIPVAKGDVLTLYPQGAPFSSFHATVTSVAYRAETTRDGYLAYRVKAEFMAGEAPPGIGQLGSARFHSGWAPLAYVMLRRPLVQARQWLGW